MTPREMKIAAARAALQQVKSGMTLGLGTGSTAEEFVRLVGEALAARALRADELEQPELALPRLRARLLGYFRSKSRDRKMGRIIKHTRALV